MDLLKRTEQHLEQEMLRKPTNYRHNEMINHNKFLNVSIDTSEDPNGCILITHTAHIHRCDASIQSKYPLCDFTGIGYFEITVRSIRGNGICAIGLARAPFPTVKQPGWLRHSYGWHSDDGKKFNNSGSGLPYGPTYTVGDVVGCAYNYRTREVFFTKNGEKLPTAFYDVDSNDVFPTIGLDQSSVWVRFAPPFMFDIEAIEREEQNIRIEEILRTPAVDPNIIKQLILRYLVQEGYHGTYLALINETELSDDLIPQTTGLQFRNQVLGLISNGDINATIQLIEKELGVEFIPNHPQLAYILHCQAFIEIIRKGGDDVISNGIQYARDNFNPILLDAECEMKIRIEDIIGLLAYTEPKESSLSFLLSQEHRNEVAQFVNKYLRTNYIKQETRNGSKRRRVDEYDDTKCSLERILQQTIQTYSCVRLNDLKIKQEFPTSIKFDD
jgi:hypothetical protein